MLSSSKISNFLSLDDGLFFLYFLVPEIPLQDLHTTPIPDEQIKEVAKKLRIAYYEGQDKKLSDFEKFNLLDKNCFLGGVL